MSKPSRFIPFLFVLSLYYNVSEQSNFLLNSKSGNVSVVLILNSDKCVDGKDLTHVQKTLVNSALWVEERVNYLKALRPLKLGVSVYKTCSEVDLLKTLVEVYQYRPWGIVLAQDLSDKEHKLIDILQLERKFLPNFNVKLIKAAVQFMSAANWIANVSVITTIETVIDFFYLLAKKENVCLRECNIVEDIRLSTLNASSEDPLVIFATASDINVFLNDSDLMVRFSGGKVLFVPLDGNVPIGMPEDSYFILPPQSTELNLKPNAQVFPTPLLLELAEPLLSFTMEMKNFLLENCNDSSSKIDCLRERPYNLLHTFPFLSPVEVVEWLNISPLQPFFGYDIYRVNSTSSGFVIANSKKVSTFNIFFDNLTVIDSNSFNATPENFSSYFCSHEVLISRNERKYFYPSATISLRTDSWIYAFLSLSFLGVIFCVAIFIFIITALCQRRTLEGNPASTLFLLCAVMLVFCAVLPFGIQPTARISKALCITKAFSITLGYAAVFSLLLSRSIVLSSAAREVGFMSHISGSIQSFLCLFIFGVQAALTLQVLRPCNDIFTQGFDFLYLISYNVVLLILLIGLTPLIYKTQRNYREGRYFSIAIILIGAVWCVWIPCFAIMCSDWREMMVCLGLVSTGGICLGAIFIPRTYLMTIAAERDKITSALPSFTTATTGLDIYRSQTQPIYDCVNVAAINAATVARAGIIPPTAPPPPPMQPPDLYTCPALPEDIDFELCCDSPTDTDKVTRF